MIPIPTFGQVVCVAGWIVAALVWTARDDARARALTAETAFARCYTDTRAAVDLLEAEVSPFLEAYRRALENAGLDGGRLPDVDYGTPTAAPKPR